MSESLEDIIRTKLERESLEDHEDFTFEIHIEGSKHDGKLRSFKYAIKNFQIKHKVLI